MGKYKYSISPDYIVKYWSRKNENIISTEKEKSYNNKRSIKKEFKCRLQERK